MRLNRRLPVFIDWLIDKTCIYSILILWSVDTLLLLPAAIWYHSGISRLLQSASCWSQVRRVHVSYCCLSSQIIWIRDVLQLFLLSLQFSGWTASMESTPLWMASVWIVMNLKYQRNLHRYWNSLKLWWNRLWIADGFQPLLSDCWKMNRSQLLEMNRSQLLENESEPIYSEPSFRYVFLVFICHC